MRKKKLPESVPKLTSDGFPESSLALTSGATLGVTSSKGTLMTNEARQQSASASR